MAALSTADIDYITKMTAHHRDAVAMATAYLKVPAGQRRAMLSEMARGVISAQTAEIAAMAAMQRPASNANRP